MRRNGKEILSAEMKRKCITGIEKGKRGAEGYRTEIITDKTQGGQNEKTESKTDIYGRCTRNSKR